MRNAVLLLRQHGLRSSNILENRIVIAENVGGSVDWDAKHAQFASQGLHQINRLTHRRQLAAVSDVSANLN
jgi:hypothetical protein